MPVSDIPNDRMRRVWLAQQMSADVRFCEGFRMPAADERCHRHRRPASESLQGRKPRWGDVWQCRMRYGELRAARNFEAGRLSTAVRAECEHNLDDTAQVLLNGESNFFGSFDFKELGVAERAHSTTLRDDG